MALASVPFKFTTWDGQAEEPVAGAWLKGVRPPSR
jgi:hypothetical protein